MANAVTVVRATSEHFPTVLVLVERLLRELTADPGLVVDPALVAQLDQAGEQFVGFLALDNLRQPVGVVTLTEALAIYAGGRYGIISELYVVPEHRSAGVGAQLLAAVRGEARRRHWLRVDVTAPPDERWDRSLAFYQNNGFVITGRKLKLPL